MVNKIKIKDKAILIRRHSKLFEIICWDVLTADGKTRLAVIRQLNDQYLVRRFGWQQFPIKYWQASIFWTGDIIIAYTRKSIIEKVLEIRGIK